MEDGSSILRPVIRTTLAGKAVIFTRIDPEKKGSSMIFRPRPGWEELKAHLAEKRRCVVFLL